MQYRNAVKLHKYNSKGLFKVNHPNNFLQMHFCRLCLWHIRPIHKFCHKVADPPSFASSCAHNLEMAFQGMRSSNDQLQNSWPSKLFLTSQEKRFYCSNTMLAVSGYSLLRGKFPKQFLCFSAVLLPHRSPGFVQINCRQHSRY